MKHINIVFANLNAFSCNKGCMALGESTLAIFNRLLKNSNIDYEFTLTDSEIQDFKDCAILIGSEEIKFKVVHSFQFNLPSVIKSITKGDFFQYLNAIRNADYIFDIGHGDSFSDIYGKNRFKDIDRIHFLARVFRKKYIFLPQTIGPFINNKIRKSARKSLLSSYFVMARDVCKLFKYRALERKIDGDDLN